MLKTALKMLKEVSNPYLFSNFLKTVTKTKNCPKIANFFYQMSKFQAEKKSKLKKSGSTMTCAISQLVYMPNVREIGQSV